MKCDHCGKRMEVIVAPKEGQTFTVHKKVIARLLRIAEKLDDMNVKIIQIHAPQGEDTRSTPLGVTELGVK